MSTTLRNDIETLFNAYCDWQVANNRGTQIGIYSIAAVGLSLAIRRVRPFSKFTQPHHVPNSFIAKRREIIGTVQRIEPNGALLMVNHSPLIRLPGLNTSNRPLPVKIANVNVTGLGINWLQSIVAGNRITFVPLAKEPTCVLCQVNVQSRKEETIDVGESLMAVGFAKFENRPAKVNDIMHKIYIDRLKYAEELHIKREMGLKYYAEQSKMVLVLIARFLYKYSVVQIYALFRKLFARTMTKSKTLEKPLAISV